MADSPSLNITPVLEGQAQKELTMNTAILALEAATQYTFDVNMTSGNVVLTTTQYTRNVRFLCTGHAVARDLTVPLVVEGVELAKRLFLVVNSGTGIVTVKGATGTTVAVPVGAKTLCYADGVNINKVVSSAITASEVSDFSEAVDDRVAALFIPGTGITLTYNDVANTFTIDSSGGGGGGGFPAPTFKGAMVKLTSDEVSPAFPYIVVWDAAEYDTNVFWSAGAPTRLTIPAGVTKVRLHGSILAEATLTVGADLSLIIHKNGTAVYVGSVTEGMDAVFTTVVGAITSPVLSVIAGDYFELRFNSTDTTVTIEQNSTFSIEVLDSDPTPLEGGVDTIAGTTHTPIEGDDFKYFRTTNAAAVTVTIAPEATEPFVVGTELYYEQAGAGVVTFVEGVGVTINVNALYNQATNGQFSVVTLKKVGVNEWTILGNLDLI